MEKYLYSGYAADGSSITVKSELSEMILNRQNARRLAEQLIGGLIGAAEAEQQTEIERLRAINGELLEIAKTVRFWFDNEANYPEGTNGYKIAQEAKEAIKKAENK